MSEVKWSIRTPPYWGVPRVSHQLPVEVVDTDVVALEVTAVDVVDNAFVVVVIAVDVVVDAVVVGTADVVVVVDVEPQDANNSDATMTSDSDTKIVALFIKPPLLLFSS
jgi:hypothetical protein